MITVVSKPPRRNGSKRWLLELREGSKEYRFRQYKPITIWVVLKHIIIFKIKGGRSGKDK